MTPRHAGNFDLVCLYFCLKEVKSMKNNNKIIRETFIGKSKRRIFGESLTDKNAEEVLKMIKTEPKKEGK